jgi:hypothetical protein
MPGTDTDNAPLIAEALGRAGGASWQTLGEPERAGWINMDPAKKERATVLGGATSASGTEITVAKARPRLMIHEFLMSFTCCPPSNQPANARAAANWNEFL